MSSPFQMKIPELLPNNSFSRKNPLLQTDLDSTSLNEFKICPRRYFYSIICGYQPIEQSVHLTFGILMHQAVEHYWQARLEEDLDHQSALRRVLREVLTETWDRERQRPWQTDAKNKNRFTLVRTIVWYLDTYQDDPVETIRLKSGKAAVELPFGVNTKYYTSTGENFVLRGKMDRLGKLNDFLYVADVKTTQRPINQGWFSKFTPDNQFSIYSIAAHMVYGTDVAGILVDGCQIVQTFSDFHRGIVQRTPEQREAWMQELSYFLMELEYCAEAKAWPMNDSACNLWGGCPFRPVCSAQTESIKEMILEHEYRRRVWDPTFRPLDY